MYPIVTAKIRSFERALLFRDGELVDVLLPGTHRRFDPLGKLRVDVLSARDPWIRHADLDLAVKGGWLHRLAEVIDLAEHERALVWIDGRLDRALGPGRTALWTGFRDVRVERFDARRVRFEHADLAAVLAADADGKLLESLLVPQGAVGVVYVAGALAETLPPGRYAFWKGVADLKLYTVDRREAVLDIAGQEIMTRDKVTLRMNAVVTFRVDDAAAAMTRVEDFRQTLYREAQLAVRAAVGTRTLEELLADKDAIGGEVAAALRGRAAGFGVEVVAFGLRDIILPGEMKELLNKVIEAQKAAEAALITRREETAAIRNQANTARLLEGSPTLMRLRELEAVEKIAQSGKLSVIVGEKGLAERLLAMV
jgi:regulator of protease activity HflC (stomatin/prohibitin superfamily)